MINNSSISIFNSSFSNINIEEFISIINLKCYIKNNTFHNINSKSKTFFF